MVAHGDQHSTVKAGMNVAASGKPRQRQKKQVAKKAKTSKKAAVKQREPKVVRSRYQKVWDELSPRLRYQLRQHWILAIVAASVCLLLVALYFAVDIMDVPFGPPVTDTVT